jgi:hypothetical protein
MLRIQVARCLMFMCNHALAWLRFGVVTVLVDWGSQPKTIGILGNLPPSHAIESLRQSIAEMRLRYPGQHIECGAQRGEDS